MSDDDKKTTVVFSGTTTATPVTSMGTGKIKRYINNGNSQLVFNGKVFAPGEEITENLAEDFAAYYLNAGHLKEL